MEVFFPKQKKRITRIFAAIVIVLALFSLWLFASGTSAPFRDRLDKISFNLNPIIRHFSPTWRSVKRLADLPFVLVYTFNTTDLPTYSLSINDRDQMRLVDNLPDYPNELFLGDEFKNSVGNIRFSSGEYLTTDADVRYRGNSARHWDAYKKSWQIQLPDEKPLYGRTVLRLVLPEDRGWAREALNAYRGKKLEVITPEISFVRLRVNDRDMGVYTLMEGWEESFLENNNRPLGSIFANIYADKDLFTSSSLPFWEDRFSKDGLMEPEKERVLTYFLKLISSSPDEEFERYLPTILDMDSFYRYAVIVLASGGTSPINVANQNLYLNPTSGKLEPILFDISLTEMTDSFDVKDNRLFDRVLRQEKFRKEFETYARNYFLDEKNLEDDLNFYDKTVKKIRSEIFSDTTKLPSNLEVLYVIRTERKIFENNFNLVKGMLENSDTLSIAFGDEEHPVDETRIGTNETEYGYMASESTIDEFLRTHRQFARLSATSVLLPLGTHVFTKNVIVPKGLEVHISPGATLLFSDNVSFLSYSPVQAPGTQQERITFSALNTQKPWNSFVIANTDNKSVFAFSSFSYGSGVFINGIASTGMLTANNAPISISYSRFSNTFDDDAINVKFGEGEVFNSYFTHTFSDAIDFDFNGGTIEGNTFAPPIGAGIEELGGDAVDVSFSSVHIKNNTVLGCGDKGISVGEKATPIISGMTIMNCSVGIAVKDGAQATIENSIIAGNKTGVSLYLKKPHFMVGGTASIINSVLWNTQNEITHDNLSGISISSSTVKGGYKGTDINIEMPDFSALLGPLSRYLAL